MNRFVSAVLQRTFICASAFSVFGVTTDTVAHAQPAWLRAYVRRSASFTADQPTWAGPIFTQSPLLRQALREDFTRSITPAGLHTWNLGTAKGLELVPLPRTQFLLTLPPYFRFGDGAGNGFGDVTTEVKVKLAASEDRRGNYAISAQLNASIPTGGPFTGSQQVVFAPTLLAGKGLGRVVIFVAAGGTLPYAGTATLGRSAVLNTVVQYHAARYLWTALETNTTPYFGGTRDGKVQTFLSPTLTVGRLPYRPGETDRRRAITVGIGYQIAATRFHNSNHVLAVTTRLHF